MPTRKGDWPCYLMCYFIADTEYSMTGDPIILANRVIITKTLRADMLADLHHGHPNIRGIKPRAEDRSGQG